MAAGGRIDPMNPGAVAWSLLLASLLLVAAGPPAPAETPVPPRVVVLTGLAPTPQPFSIFADPEIDATRVFGVRGVPADATLVVRARAETGAVRMSLHDPSSHGPFTVFDSYAQDADHGATRLQARPGGRDWDVIVDPGPGGGPSYRIVVTFEAYRKDPAFGVPIELVDLGPWWCPLHPAKGCLP